MMRILMIAMLLLGLAWSPQYARAQTYDPRYSVCLQSYGPNGGISCSYSSMAECRLAAGGRGAQCVANPYRSARRSHRY